jgi:serine-type D-Ala-D-Ala carboxypeptidase (penicillin-binding protein 5/6)
VRRARRFLAVTVCLLGVLAPAAPALAGAPAVPLAAWIIVDGRDGRVFAQHAPYAQRAVASLTKMMTVYLALQAGALSRTFTVPNEATRIGQSTVGLRTGQRVSGELLVEAALVPSANDAADALAVGIGGSRAAFVAQMNATARRLGMRDTRYQQPYGLDVAGQYSTAHDSLIIGRLLFADRDVQRIARMRSISINGHRYAAADTLLGHYPGLDGVKTGHTSAAGWCQVATARQDGQRLFVVALGAGDGPTRDRALTRLLDWGFAQFRRVRVVRAGAAFARVPVAYAKPAVTVIAQRDVIVALRPHDRVRLLVTLADHATPPIHRGDRLGSVAVYVGATEVASTPLVAAADRPAISLLDRLEWAWQTVDPFR